MSSGVRRPRAKARIAGAVPNVIYFGGRRRERVSRDNGGKVGWVGEL